MSHDMAADVAVSMPDPLPNDRPSNQITNGVERNEDVNEPKPQIPRPKRPNFAQIHAKPLPLDVYPLPAFIPHNPLSLVRIAIALISQSFWPPSSQTVIHTGYFSKETQSVHVTDAQSIRALWEQGFFGKGSLSRSEPRWLDQEKRKRGLVASLTSEEATRLRREERRQFKLERARKEREAIEQQLREEGKPYPAIQDEEVSVESDLDKSQDSQLQASDERTEGVSPIPTSDSCVVADDNLRRELEEGKDISTQIAEEICQPDIQNQEHLQLTPEEAFFLAHATGALQVYRNNSVVPSSYLLRLFCTYSTFPFSEKAEAYMDTIYRLTELHGRNSIDFSETGAMAPDNPFILRYVVYLHFRSLGWVVRPGVKFAVDYLLYNRGPVFAHAEFAVIIIPSYSHQYWTETSERKAEVDKRQNRGWWWLHRINRVQTQVQKTLVLVYVEVPPPLDEEHRMFHKLNVGDVLQSYKVREFVVRRWTPNRNRD
ncbi:hypothetical protein K469DRAFT_344243 [Zopfia rhizophila CBS 207.26]|uniref:tRNA-splicing endonuclease subunit Sen2 n=1 Tax=Zopfia rhizophila CBS 207.26 TaxID=1314779 RepID=A0A6A6EIH5_9PEZI|nr:hypothetical protein K469DRAFT_344243 [Zopfia rhizophila CBS 207.26]